LHPSVLLFILLSLSYLFSKYFITPLAVVIVTASIVVTFVASLSSPTLPSHRLRFLFPIGEVCAADLYKPHTLYQSYTP
jgi:hypothetical protein